MLKTITGLLVVALVTLAVVPAMAKEGTAQKHRLWCQIPGHHCH